MLVGQRLELSDQLAVPAELDLVLDELLARVQAQLIEAGGLADREGLGGEVGERGPAPQAERGAQRFLGLLGWLGSGCLDEVLELLRVHLLCRDLEGVAGGLPDEHLVGSSRRFKRASELRDVDLDDVVGRRRRVVAPQELGEPFEGDDVVGLDEQDGEERALLGAAEGERLVATRHLEGAEDPELHRGRSHCEPTAV